MAIFDSSVWNNNAFRFERWQNDIVVTAILHIQLKSASLQIKLVVVCVRVEMFLYFDPP